MGWTAKWDAGENKLCSLSCRQDVVDGHIVKQQHEWFPILQLALRQNGTTHYTWLINGDKYQTQLLHSCHFRSVS